MQMDQSESKGERAHSGLGVDDRKCHRAFCLYAEFDLATPAVMWFETLIASNAIQDLQSYFLYNNEAPYTILWNIAMIHIWD